MKRKGEKEGNERTQTPLVLCPDYAKLFGTHSRTRQYNISHDVWTYTVGQVYTECSRQSDHDASVPVHRENACCIHVNLYK